MVIGIANHVELECSMSKKSKKKKLESQTRAQEVKATPLPFDPFQPRRIWLIAIFALAIILRIIYHIQDSTRNPLYNDPVSDAGVYFKWGMDMAKGTMKPVGVYYMAPLYPYILAGIFKIFGANISSAIIFQHVVGLLNLALVYLIAKKTFGERVAILSAIIYALHPLFPFNESKILLTTFTLFFYLLSIYLLTFHKKERPNYLLTFTAGIILGISVVQRPNILLFILLVIVWLYLLYKPNYKWVVVSSIILLVGVAIPISPVTIHNYKASGEFVFLTSNSGVNFYYGANPDAAPTFTRRGQISDSIENEEVKAKKAAEEAMGRQLGPAEVSSYWMKRGFEEIGKKPLSWIGYEFKKLFWTINTYEIPNNYNIQFEMDKVPALRIFFIPYGFICLFGIIGIWLIQKRNPLTILLLFYLAAIEAGLLMFTVVSRFRVPLTVILLMFAAYGLLEFIDAMRSRNRDLISSKKFFAALLILVLLAAPTLIPFRKKTNPASTYHNLGVVEYRKQNYEKAIEYQEMAIRAFPKYAEAFNDMASCYWRLGDQQKKLGDKNKMNEMYTKAIETYSKADDSSPTYAESRYNAGLLYYVEFKDYPNAIKKLNEALKIRPDYIKAKVNLSFAWFYSGRVDEAIALAQELIKMEPDNATHNFNLGLMLKQKGDVDDARQQFNEALRKNPNYEDVKKELQKIGG